MVLLLSAVPTFGQSLNRDWQALIDEHAALITAGQYQRSIAVAQKALALAEAKNTKANIDVVISLNKLARSYGLMARYNDALPLYQRALSIYENIYGPDHPETANGLNNLAVTYSDLGQFDKALPLHMRDLAIIETAFGPEHLDTATSLSNLALTYSRLARHKDALPLRLRALAIRERILDPAHPAIAQSLNNLAATYSYLAQYENALPLQQRALVIRENAGTPNQSDIAQSLNNLGTTYFAMGQFDRAIDLYLRGLEINESSLGPEHPNTAILLTTLALAYRATEQYDKALELFLRALQINLKVRGSDHPDTARSYHNVGTTYYYLGQYQDALPMQLKALAIREKVFGIDHLNTADSLNNLAYTYSAIGQEDKVLPLLQRAQMTYVKALGPEHPAAATSLSNIAASLSRTGQSEAAIPIYKSAINTYQSQRERISRIGASELRSYTESISKAYQALAALLIEQGRLPEAQRVLDMLKEEEQFEFIRRNAIADRRETRIGYNTVEQTWVRRYRQIADQLAALGVEQRALEKRGSLGLNAEQTKRKKVLLEDLRIAQTAFDSFLNEMRGSFARQGLARSQDFDETSEQALNELKRLLTGLGDGAALLQYYVTEDKVGMLLTTPGIQLARSSKVSAKDLNRQIAEFRRLLRDPKTDPLPSAQALYQLLVAPVAQDLEQAGAKTVMLSLDGALRYLPFGALHDGKSYLVQRWNLPMYTSVTKNRLSDANTNTWQAAGLGVTKAIGDFAALTAVKAEMSSIVRTSAGGVLPGEVHLDEAFTALRLKDVTQRRFELLHVASHFRFSPGTEANSFLLLGDGQQLTLGDMRTQNFRFDNVDLLTLSACETGLGGGRNEKGREIEGFGVIAQQQGAKAVLATLWPVADQSTAKLMAEMYARRQEQQLTKIEALRQAQLSLLAESRYAHPFYWGPFILMGNWK